MAAEAVVRARIDAEIKTQAAEALAEMGLSVSDAIRMLMIRVARDKALPFQAKVPNADSLAAIAELERGGGESYSSVEEMFKDLGL